MGPVGDMSDLLEKIDRLEQELRGMGRRLDRSERSGRRMARLAGIGAFLAAALLVAGGAALVQQFNRVDVIGPNNDIRNPRWPSTPSAGARAWRSSARTAGS